MTFRFVPLLLVLAGALLVSGCASVEQSSDDQMDTFHSTPEKAEDSHGWGESVGPMSGGRQ